MNRVARCDQCGAPVDLAAGAATVSCLFCGASIDVATIPTSVERPPPTTTPRESYRVGEAVLVEWNGGYWPARVVEVLSPHEWRIRYDGYSSSWNEDVGPDRIAPSGADVPRATSRSSAIVVGLVLVLIVVGVGLGIAMGGSGGGGASGATVAPSTSRALATGESVATGQSVVVSWNGRWYDATVLSDAGSTIRIHYVGWSDSWDEDVARDRVRAH